MEELRANARKKEKSDGRATSWISDPTWRLIDQRTDARKRRKHVETRRLGVQVKWALNVHCKARAAAPECALLEEERIRYTFGAIQGWYMSTGPRPAKPSREEIDFTREEYKHIFTYETPTGEPFPVHTERFNIVDGPPTDMEVTESLMKMHNHRAAGARVITAENLKA